MRKYLLLLMTALLALTLCSCSCRHKTVVTDAAAEASCTGAGKTEGTHCEKCGQVLIAQEEIPAFGHTYVMDAQKDPTCTEVGAAPGFHCDVCGEVFFAQEEIPALGHTEVTDAAVAPGCTATGLTEGKHCAVCGEVFTAQEEVPATGHVPFAVSAEEYPIARLEHPEGLVCSICGEIFPFLTNEASETTEVTQNEDGTSVACEQDETWGLTRESRFDEGGKLTRSAIAVGSRILFSAEYDSEGAACGFTQTLYTGSDSPAGEAFYDAEGNLVRYTGIEYDEIDRAFLVKQFDAEQTLTATEISDLNEAGELIRLRVYYPDETFEFHVFPEVDPQFDYAVAVSDVWTVCSGEIGLKAESEDSDMALGILPRKNGNVTVGIVDCLTGETVQSKEVCFGETVTFDVLPEGYYFLTASCEGYSDWTSEVCAVFSESIFEKTAEWKITMENPDAQFEEPVRIRVTDAEGNPRSRVPICLGITRNNSGFMDYITLETDRSGYVCFLSTSVGESSSSETYSVAAFLLREGCILGYVTEDGTFTPIVLDGTGESMISF